MMGISNKDEEEVDRLLRAAEDDLLLKLSVDSHMSRVSPNYLESDLDRRFQLLKSRPRSTPGTAYSAAGAPPPFQSLSPSQPEFPSSSSVSNTLDGGELESLIGLDLSSRFAALKASLPSARNVDSSPAMPEDNDEDNDEDEVEKLIRWAKDAARLDPSPPSDDGGDGDKDELSDSDDNEDEDDRKGRRK